MVVKKAKKLKYKLWQYPIIFIWLFLYLVKFKFKIKSIIAWRREIGILELNEKITVAKMLSFGHWGMGQDLIDWWFNK